MTAKTIRNYESAFAELFDSSRAFAFWKGRVALYSLLKAIGVGPGDEVIVPAYTCLVDVTPIKYLGAIPIFIDIEPVTYNMNIDLLEGLISSRTKVIIAQHTYGYVLDMERVISIAQKHGVIVYRRSTAA